MIEPKLEIDPISLTQLCRQHDLVLVVLFGSRAKGVARPESDSDIGVLRRQGLLTSLQFNDLFSGLSEILPFREIDLVDLRRAPPLLKYGVAHYGKILYEDEPGRFNLFHVSAWKLYLDDCLTLRNLDAVYIQRFLQARRVPYEPLGINRRSA